MGPFPLPRRRPARWQYVAQAVLTPLLAAVWHLFLAPTAQDKALAFLYAAAFAAIEFGWYSTTVQLPDGNVRFAPFSKACRPGFTTWAQFWANVVYTPVMVALYRQLVPWAALRVLLFPLNIWVFEALCGFLLLRVWNTRAWYYEGSDAYLDGTIKLGYAPHWWLLGAAAEVAYPLVLAPSAAALEHRVAAPLSLALARDVPLPPLAVAAALAAALGATLALVLLADDGRGRRWARFTVRERECFDRITHTHTHEESAVGGGGGVSYRTLWTPMRQPELRAAVVLVHGYGAHGGVWAPIAQRLALGHCAVCALDLQGHGRSGSRHGSFEAETAIRDTLQAARSLAADYPAAPLLLLGSGSGAAVVAHAAARDAASADPLVKGVIMHRCPVALLCTGALVGPGVVSRALRSLACTLLPCAPLPKGAAAVDACREVLPSSVLADGLCTGEGTVPVAAADELHRLLASLPRALPLIRAPALVIDGGRNELESSASAAVRAHLKGKTTAARPEALIGGGALLEDAAAHEAFAAEVLSWAEGL